MKTVCMIGMVFFASALWAQIGPEPLGPYLGQAPPGSTAVPFAVGFLGADLHSGPVFSDDGKEVFWSRLDGSTGHIMTSVSTDGGWSVPREVEFATGAPAAGEPDYHQMDFIMPSGEPCLSPDGTRMFFIAQESAATDYKEKIWVATRQNNGWGPPTLVNPAINALSVHWQISVAGNGNLYFHARESRGGDIYVSVCENNAYQVPVALGPAVNSDHGEASPFIAPDESYLIFTRMDRSSSRKAELFISFRDADGAWAEARCMDKVNKDGVNDLCATVSRDGKYLFFLRNTPDGLGPHWVSASVIDDYR